MSLRTYKLIKATTQLAAVAAGIFAIHEGAAPGLIYPLIAVVVAGPEIMEYSIANAEDEDAE